MAIIPDRCVAICSLVCFIPTSNSSIAFFDLSLTSLNSTIFSSRSCPIFSTACPNRSNSALQATRSRSSVASWSSWRWRWSFSKARLLRKSDPSWPRRRFRSPLRASWWL
uniref:(northern house mosquito) hypothetical protein n=1 Tax=Culex pipiens TaxID=7175 RepID=A0A8D8MND5_CULPI